jgi:hypothetical protein
MATVLSSKQAAYIDSYVVETTTKMEAAGIEPAQDFNQTLRVLTIAVSRSLIHGLVGQ